MVLKTWLPQKSSAELPRASARNTWLCNDKTHDKYMIKYMAVAVAVAVSGGVAVPVAVPMATTKNPKRTLF